MRYREGFISKVPEIALQTNFRYDIFEKKLLNNPEALLEYLEKDEHNPDKRMAKMVELLTIKPHLATKDQSIIAKESGVKLYEPSTKKQLAEFMTYAVSKAGGDIVYTEDMIGDPVSGEQRRHNALDSLMVTNLNLNLRETAEFLWTLEDFNHYNDVYDVIFINLNQSELPHAEIFHELSGGRKPELALVGITKDGHKFLTHCSIDEAEEIFSTTLSHIPLLVKWGGYNFQNGKFIWAKRLTKKPDIVIYNQPADMTKSFMGQDKNMLVSLEYLAIQAHESGSIQSLIVRQKNGVLHVVNDLGNKRINEAVKFLKKNGAKKLKVEELKEHAIALNGFLYMLDLNRKVNWVETMITQTLVRS